jgi:CDGSH-type Zn-finger protein
VAAALLDIAEKIGTLATDGDAGSFATIAAIDKSFGVSTAPEHHGPYLVGNVSQLTNSNCDKIAPRIELILRRCGHSRIKPFRSGKSPKRTPDKRDTYVGDEVTRFDNRGTCFPSKRGTLRRSGRCERARDHRYRSPMFVRRGQLRVRRYRRCRGGAAATDIRFKRLVRMM